MDLSHIQPITKTTRNKCALHTIDHGMELLLLIQPYVQSTCRCMHLFNGCYGPKHPHMTQINIPNGFVGIFSMFIECTSRIWLFARMYNKFACSMALCEYGKTCHEATLQNKHHDSCINRQCVPQDSDISMYGVNFERYNAGYQLCCAQICSHNQLLEMIFTFVKCAHLARKY